MVTVTKKGDRFVYVAEPLGGAKVVRISRLDLPYACVSLGDSPRITLHRTREATRRAFRANAARGLASVAYLVRRG